eukprot:gene12069-biopygen12415
MDGHPFTDPARRSVTSWRNGRSSSRLNAVQGAGEEDEADPEWEDLEEEAEALEYFQNEESAAASSFGNPEDWDLWYANVEFGINDTRSDVTGFTPFELVLGYSPMSQLDLFLQAATGQHSKRKGGEAGTSLARAFTHHRERFFSDHQRELPEIDRGAPVAYRLKLPPKWRIHDVFAQHRLKEYRTAEETFALRQQVPTPPKYSWMDSLRPMWPRFWPEE